MDFKPLFDAFMTAANAPDGGAAVFDAYASTARLYSQFQVRPKAEIDRDEFTMLFQASFELHLAEKPGQPRKPDLTDVRQVRAELEGADRAVVWFEAEERSDRRQLAIAVGFRRELGAWKIDWLTLAASPQPWDYAMGLAQTVADYPYGSASLDVVPRSWLDLAYYRLFGHERPPLLTLPEARFSCGSSGVCCSIDWSIAVPKDAQHVIDAIPWAALGRPDLEGTVLPEDGDGKLRLKQDGAPCRFLDEHRHCVIHKHLGRAAFGPCATFPFVFTVVPDGVAVAASPVCGTARQNLGQPLPERADDLYGRLAMSGVESLQPPSTFRLHGDRAIPYEEFRAIEAELLAWLGRDDLPLRRRLWVASRYLTALAAGREPAWAQWEQQPWDIVPEQHRINADDMMERFATSLRVRDPGPMYGSGVGPVRIDQVMATVVRNLIHSKIFSLSLSLTIGLNVCVLLYLLTERLAAEHGPEGVPEAHLMELAKRLTHGDLIKKLLAQSTEDYQQLRHLLDQPAAGTWMLSALEAPADLAAR